MSVASPVPNDPAAVIVNLSGYRFVTLDNLPLLQHDLFQALDATGVKGTVLLATEGINVALAGSAGQVTQARECLDRYPELRGLWLKQSYSTERPFARLKVRQRREIISFLPPAEVAHEGPAAARTEPGDPPAGPPPSTAASPGNAQALSRAHFEAPPAATFPATSPETSLETAPAISPAELAGWLDRGQDFTLLDTRNDYEVASGSFARAQHLDIGVFRQFTAAVEAGLADGSLDPDKPVVTFCTGGIRCEKAAPWLLERGFREVHQLEGGILNYFEQCGGRHWQGDCFVFDDRVEVDAGLRPTGASLCRHCQHAVPAGQSCRCQQSPAEPVPASS